MAYRIGIDAGSKTIKIVVLDEANLIVCSLYRRHHSDILGSLSCALHDLICEYGDIAGSVAITGSAGIGLASSLQLPFVQEVIATTRAVQAVYPQADAIIELGGEDAKIVYLTHGMEQRMNATCAGGTGGFIDTIAFMLGVQPEDMNALASKASRIYPIASRCAVFAQTDIRPLLNAGVATTDLAASALDAVVRQTIGGLACGRPIKGTVIFLGGPLEHIPELAKRFRDALDIEEDAGIKPHDAHLFTACGAAILGGEEWENFARSHLAAIQDVVRGSTQDTTQAAAHPAAQAVARDVSRETISAAKIAHPVPDVENTAKNVSHETICEQQKRQQNLSNENNPSHNVSRETISDKSSVPEITSSTESNSRDVSRETIWNPKCERPILETEKPARIVSRETICETQKVRPDYGAGSDSARDVSRETISLSWLEKKLRDTKNPEKDLMCLPPLFKSEAAYAAFRERHDQHTIKRSQLSACTGPLYLGIDAGSTTMKMAVINDACELVYADYHTTKGDALDAATKMLARFYDALTSSVAATSTHGSAHAYIAHACATGYGEDLLRAGLGIDSGVVETLAHVRAARAFQPEVTFVLDIGGQDIKAIWVKNGRVTNAVLNEACSSGCGAFLEETAHALNLTPDLFAEAATHASAPVDLGAKCSVFMTSRVRHAQEQGIDTKDIAAGLAYSVVKNALYRIIGVKQMSELGDHIVVQGGTFMSDAVLRAFELEGNLDVVRPDTAHLMGAIGAALTARMRVHTHTASFAAKSTLLSAEKLAHLKPQRTAMRCNGCENACTLSVVAFEDGRCFISGNRCERAYECVQQKTPLPSRIEQRQQKPPNAVAVQQHLLAQYGDVTGSTARGSARIGYLNTLSCYERTPFWHTLLKTLGFSLIIPRDERAHANGVAQAGLASIPSESVCFPAKLSHMRLYDVVNEGAQAAFMPYSSRGEKCAVTTTYALALKDSSPLLRENKCTLIAPELTWPSPTIMRETGEGIPELLHSLNVFTTKAGVTPVSTAELLDAFDAGLAEQIAFADAVQKANERVLAWSERTQGRIVLLAGRPYHMDPAMLHGIDKILVDVGFGVLSQLRSREIFKQEKKSSAEERVAAKLRQAKPVDGETPWMPGKHFRRLASLAIKHPQIELVCLQSFGCGYDSVSLMEAREMMEAAGRAFTALKIDDITDTAHIRIRLRTLAETMEDEAKSPAEAVKREEKHLLRSRKAPQARTRTATKPAEATAETVEDER